MKHEGVVAFMSMLTSYKAKQITIEALIDWAVEQLVAAQVPTSMLQQFSAFVPPALIPYLTRTVALAVQRYQTTHALQRYSGASL